MRRPDRSQAVGLRHAIAALTGLAFVTVPSLTTAAEALLALEMVVNGHATGKIGEFVLRDGALFARLDELQSLGFRVPKTASAGADGLVALSALPQLAWHINQSTQVLEVTATNSVLEPTLLQAGMNPENGASLGSGTGVTLDYTINDTYVTNQNIGSGLFDLRAFSPWGVLSSGVLGFAGAGPNGPGSNSAVRLDTVYTYSDIDSLDRYRLGDFISGGLTWSRPVRLGGAQFSSDYSMRPDLVTFPLPTMSGSATVPSTADVLVNGTRQFSREIPPGPFEIPHLPVVTGAGTVTLMLTDALGRQVATTLPFYASSELLAPGLQTFTAEVGAVRNKWGSVSNDYGDLATAATLRRGLSNTLTLETHVEGTSGFAMAGGGLAMNVANLAILDFSIAGSTTPEQTARQLSIGAQHLGQIFSLGASAQYADSDFQDIAAQDGDPVPRRRFSANTGLSLRQFGSIGVAYTGIDRDAVPTPIRLYVPANDAAIPDVAVPVDGMPTPPPPNNLPQRETYYFLPAQHARVLSASYSVQLGKFSTYLTAFDDLVEGGERGVLGGVSRPFGARSSANVSVGSAAVGSSITQVQAQQPATTVGDWGYRLYGDNGKTPHTFGDLQYKAPWSLVSIGADQTGQQQPTLRASAQGALTFADGGLFATNTIYDSFAIVDTNGMADVHVLFENRDMGKTDSGGRLLVPELRSFDINRLAIDPTDVPADTAVALAEREVRPPYRSGVVVKFPMQASHGALLRLVDEAGKPISLGSAATLRATGVSLPVGYDGETFAQDLSPHNELAIEQPDGRRCTVRFDYQPIPGEIPILGPLPCREINR